MIFLSNGGIYPVTDNTKSDLTSHGYATAPALDLFDTATGPELKRPVDHTKVMESKPTQKTAEQWG
jgi:hypothetical protein